MKNKILVPNLIDIDNLNSEIISLFPAINKTNRNLSLKWSFKIFILLDKIRRGIVANENRFLSEKKNKKKIFKENIPFVQIPQRIRKLLFNPESPYSKRIWNEIVKKKLIRSKEYYLEETGELVEYYKMGKECKSYTFKQEPQKYNEITLPLYCHKTVSRLEELEVYNHFLNKEENEVRYQVIKNTKEIQLLSNHSSRAVLGAFLKPICRSSNEYIKSFNNNAQVGNSDDFGFRLHHKLTTLKSNLVKHCRVNDCPIIGIDIVNSQPFMGSILNSDLIQRLIKDIPRLEYLNIITPILEEYENNSDFLLFKNLCVNGKYYEHLMIKYSELFGESIKRSDVKKVNFMAFFSNYKYHNKLKKKDKKRSVELFKHSFPSVYKCFEKIQKIDLGVKYEKYKNVCLILQQLESAIIYSYVVPRLLKNNIWCSTIHDSIIIKAKDVSTSFELFKSVFVNLDTSIPKLERK